MSNKIVPSITLECCPRCAGFLVEDVLFDGQGWSNFSVQVQRCLMCQRIYEGAREYGREVGTLGMYRDWETDRKSTRLNSSHSAKSRMPSSA